MRNDPHCMLLWSLCSIINTVQGFLIEKYPNWGDLGDCRSKMSVQLAIYVDRQEGQGYFTVAMAEKLPGNVCRHCWFSRMAKDNETYIETLQFVVVKYSEIVVRLKRRLIINNNFGNDIPLCLFSAVKPGWQPLGLPIYNVRGTILRERLWYPKVTFLSGLL